MRRDDAIDVKGFEVDQLISDNTQNVNGENVLEAVPTKNTITCEHLVFLHKAYEPKYWYWEIIETVRRLFFTAILVITPMAPNVQIVGTIILSVIFMKLYGYYKPYKADSDDILQETAQYQVFFTLFA